MGPSYHPNLMKITLTTNTNKKVRVTPRTTMKAGGDFSGSFLDILNNLITTQIPGPKNAKSSANARNILKGPSKSIPIVGYYSRGNI